VRTELTAQSDRKVQWDLPVLLVPRVRQARWVRQAPRVRMELMARSDRRVQRDLSALLVPQARRARRARRVRTEPMAQREPQDLSDSRVQWDQQVQRERTELTALSDPKVQPVQPVRQAPRDLSGCKV